MQQLPPAVTDAAVAPAKKGAGVLIRIVKRASPPRPLPQEGEATGATATASAVHDNKIGEGGGFAAAFPTTTIGSEDGVLGGRSGKEGESSGLLLPSLPFVLLQLRPTVGDICRVRPARDFVSVSVEPAVNDVVENTFPPRCFRFHHARTPISLTSERVVDNTSSLLCVSVQITQPQILTLYLVVNWLLLCLVPHIVLKDSL
jgi:hypothetical protein